MSEVCMQESRPGDGHLCMCMDSHCNAASSLIGGSGSASYPLIIVALIAIILLQTFNLRHRKYCVSSDQNYAKNIQSHHPSPETQECRNHHIFLNNDTQELFLFSDVRSNVELNEPHLLCHYRIPINRIELVLSTTVVLSDRISIDKEHPLLSLSIISSSSVGFPNVCKYYYCVFVCDHDPPCRLSNALHSLLQQMNVSTNQVLTADLPTFQHICAFDWCLFAQFKKTYLWSRDVNIHVLARH